MIPLRLPRGCVALLCAVSFALPLRAAGDDLLSIYVKALDGNPDYRAAIAAYDEVVEAKPQALAKLLPQVAASAGYSYVDQTISGRYFVGSLTPDGPGIDINREDGFNNYAYALGLSQVLFQKDLFIGLDEAELQVGRASLLNFDAQNRLRLQVAEAYFGALEADDELRLARAEKTALAQLLAQTRDKAGSGLVADSELKTAQAQDDVASAALIAAEGAQQVSRVQLELLTGGQKPGLLKTLAPGFEPQPPDPLRLDDWTARAREQNLQVQAQRLGTQLARKEVERAEAQRWPTLDAQAGRTYAYADGGLSKGIGANNNHESDTRVGVKLKIPIFTGGAISSAIRAATAGVARAEAEEGARRGEAQRAAQLAYLAATGGIARVAALKQAVVSTQAAEDAARVGSEVGTKTNAELLLAVRSRYRAERDYAHARYAFLLSTLRLREAAGSLNHADLLAINRLLQ